MGLAYVGASRAGAQGCEQLVAAGLMGNLLTQQTKQLHSHPFTPPIVSYTLVLFNLDRCILRAASTRTVDSSFTCSFDHLALILDSNQAGGWRHGGATPPRWSTADIHHESGNKHNTANAVHFGLPARSKGEKGLFEL